MRFCNIYNIYVVIQATGYRSSIIKIEWAGMIWRSNGLMKKVLIGNPIVKYYHWVHQNIR